ncbi:MAG: DUF4386 domain-containing protein [Maritimibacter sp.]
MSVMKDPKSRSYARFAGALYLSVAFIGPFSILYVPSQINVAGDAAATMANLVAHRGLYMAGLAGDAAIMLIELALAVMLYFMFKPVNATGAAIAGLSRFMETAVMAVMLLLSAAALGFADPASAPMGFDDAQRAGMTGMMLHLHDAGVWVWQVFFALHLAVLGQLIVRSGLYPRLIGWAMSLGGIGYLLDSLHKFAFPEADLLGMITGIFLAVVSLAEISFALWLLIRGPRSAK